MSQERRTYHYHQRSYFWPFLLISAGVVWILINQGLIDPRSLNLLFRFWPVLLIIAGIQIMFGRRFPWIHNLILAAIFAGMVFILIKAEDFNLVSNNELITEEFTSTGDPDSVAVKLDIEYGNLEVSPTSEEGEVLFASVTHDGDLKFIDNNKDNRDIRLILENDEFMVFDFDWFDHAQVETDVEITTSELLDFSADMVSGNGYFQLGELSLEKLEIESTSGDLTIELPPGEYPTNISSTSGNVEMNVANNTDVDMQIDVTSGNVVVYLPKDSEGTITLDVVSGNVDLIIPDSVGVKLNGSTVSGNIDFDTPMVHSGDDNSGEWETANFEDAEYQLIIDFNITSGNLSVE